MYILIWIDAMDAKSSSPRSECGSSKILTYVLDRYEGGITVSNKNHLTS